MALAVKALNHLEFCKETLRLLQHWNWNCIKLQGTGWHTWMCCNTLQLSSCVLAPVLARHTWCSSKLTPSMLVVVLLIYNYMIPGYWLITSLKWVNITWSNAKILTCLKLLICFEFRLWLVLSSVTQYT